MFCYCSIIINTIMFFKFLKMKNFYRILLSIFLGITLTILIIIFDNIIFNAYCTLTDLVGYNSITKFIHFFVDISDWIILIILQLISVNFYITKNKLKNSLIKIIS